VKSLAARLVVTYVALIVATTGSAGFAIMGLTRRYFVDAERQSMLVQARVVAASCDDRCVTAGALVSPNAQLDARSLPAASNISRGQTDAPSNLEVDRRSTPQQGIQAVLPSNIVIVAVSVGAGAAGPLAAAFNGTESSSVSGRTVQAAAPVKRQGQVVAVVQATGSLENVESVVRDVRRQVLLALAASAAVATLIGIWRARAIAKPVKELTSAAHELSIGNFDAPLPTRSTADELGELSNAFDVLRNAVRSELQARSAFVGDASHELRTPLTAMRGAVEILRSDAGTRPEVRERFLSSLQTEMDRLLQLVEHLLTLNRADHQDHDPAMFEPVNVSNLCSAIVADLQPLAAQRGLLLRQSLEPSAHLVVSGEVSALRQLIINVVENAMIHAPDGEVVDVTLRTSTPDDQSVIIDVRDHGPGIAAEERERVFERFTRLDTARARSQGGAGLGLAIARSIATRHGGNITFVDPPDQEGGVVARITLPVGTTA
jgi:two-component system, OmpR family, sensor kinase